LKPKKKYSGIIVPAVTPLTSKFELDEGAVEKIFFNFYQYTISVFILGTTGESASVPLQIKKQYIKKAEQLKRDGTFLYAGISSSIVNESVELAKFYFDHGVDAVVANLPSYYALTDTQMKRYFLDLAETIAGPLVVYNIPATTNMTIPIQLVDELSLHPNIIAMKDSERSDERLRQSVALWKDREDFSHFLGWAAKSAEALIAGSDGLVPSTANLVPEIYARMVEAVEDGDHQTAFAMQELSDVYGNLYQSGRALGESLWALKTLMSEKKLCQPYVMPPLQPQAFGEEQKLMDAFRQLDLSLKTKAT
jgi:dihydrodipicolinate synthase/N-acetylneuraminate lyase